MSDISSATITSELSPRGDLARSDADLLRLLAVVAGFTWSVAFVVLGLRYDLQMYGDGSIFSYSVAVEDGWLFHWHNIASRLFVHVLCHIPAEAYVRLTADARGGIAIYGSLFFGAQLLGLLATYAVDRSKRLTLFTYACGSTACLCPLVFGFPTEMWIAHALFWPTLTLAHCARGRFSGPTLFSMLVALILTHEGALIFALTILATLLLRGRSDLLFRRAGAAFLGALAVWLTVKVQFPPDAYISHVLASAALNFVDVSSFTLDPLRLLLLALGGYVICAMALRRAGVARGHLYAVVPVAILLVVHTATSDAVVEGENRYFLRTALLIFTPMLGSLAAATVLAAGGFLRLPVPLLWRIMPTLKRPPILRLSAGALLIAVLVHALETERFVVAWRDYESAVRTLATGTASDASLGDKRFVSANRLPQRLDGLVWASTTHFLSVLVAPAFAPARLVVDPDANYFWLSCKAATANADANRAVPPLARELVRIHACLHRR